MIVLPKFMSKPEFTPEETGHERFTPNDKKTNLSKEKKEEYLNLGKAIAGLEGINIEDIENMPDMMMNSFLEAKKNKSEEK